MFVQRASGVQHFRCAITYAKLHIHYDTNQIFMIAFTVEQYQARVSYHMFCFIPTPNLSKAPQVVLLGSMTYSHFCLSSNTQRNANNKLNFVRF